MNKQQRTNKQTSKQKNVSANVNVRVNAIKVFFLHGFEYISSSTIRSLFFAMSRKVNTFMGNLNDKRISVSLPIRLLKDNTEPQLIREGIQDEAEVHPNL